MNDPINDTLLVIMDGMSHEERQSAFDEILKRWPGLAPPVTRISVTAPAHTGTRTRTSRGKGWRLPHYWVRHVSGINPREQRAIFGIEGPFVSAGKIKALPTGAILLVGATTNTGKWYALCKRQPGASAPLPTGDTLDDVEIIGTYTDAKAVDTAVRSMRLPTPQAAVV